MQRLVFSPPPRLGFGFGSPIGGELATSEKCWKEKPPLRHIFCRAGAADWPWDGGVTFHGLGYFFISPPSIFAILCAVIVCRGLELQCKVAGAGVRFSVFRSIMFSFSPRVAPPLNSTSFLDHPFHVSCLTDECVCVLACVQEGRGQKEGRKMCGCSV